MQIEQKAPHLSKKWPRGYDIVANTLRISYNLGEFHQLTNNIIFNKHRERETSLLCYNVNDHSNPNGQRWLVGSRKTPVFIGGTNETGYEIPFTGCNWDGY